MKYYVVSDIHGSPVNLEKVLQKFDQDGDQLIVLGDILYHGPRNPLPLGHDPKRVAVLLNERKNKIIAVRGNCDGEVDQMVLEFPMTSDYNFLWIDGVRFFLSHGHLFEESELSFLNHDDVYLFGHVHLPIGEEKENFKICNPGSITLPKQENPATYAVIENGCFQIMDMNDNCIKSLVFKK